MSCTSPDPPDYCSAESPELKLYQAFIFSVPVFFTFVLLLFFYLFYLRRRRANWQSLRMRTNNLTRDNTRLECGLKKEVREMLPVVIFKESFLIRETQCSVCLADYQPDEKLQKIPPCGHTFHINCIDHWLSTNTTCPLCRVSLLPAPKATSIDLDLEAQTSVEESLNVNHHQEGLVDGNTPQEGQAAESDGVGSVQAEELHSDVAEPLTVTVVAEPQDDAEGSPSTTCQTVKGKK